MKKLLLMLVLIIIVVLSSTNYKPEESSLRVLKSEFELTNILRTMKRQSFYAQFSGNFRNEFAVESADISNYTKTNNQIENIDEADVLKTNGEMTYFIDNNLLYVYQTNPNKAIKLLFKHNLNNEEYIYYNNLLLFEDYLVVLGQTHNYFCYGFNDCMSPMEGGSTREDVGSSDEGTSKDNESSLNAANNVSMETSLAIMVPQMQQILVYKVKDTSLTLQDKFEIEGSYLGARMIEETLFLITNKYNYSIYRENKTLNADDLLPQRILNNKKIDPKVSEIVVTKPDSLNMLSISKLNVTTSKFDSLSYMSNATQILLYEDILFVASFSYDYQNTTTEITSFNVNTLQPISSQRIEGYLLNSFAMDYYDNHLRVALTTNDQDVSSNRLVILDSNLKIKSSINNLAKDERIYSVLFKQDKAYVVTFKEIDPFFVFDLSNPSNPVKLSELKIPGFSNYLHQVDENTIVGFGKDVKLEQGFIREASFKISMFDVSDAKNPQEVDILMVGNDYVSSDVLYNHRSLLVDSTRKWFGFVLSDFSVVIYEDNSNNSSTNYFQQFVLFDASNQKITVLYQQKSKINQYFIRSIIVNDTLFIFSNTDVTIIDTNTFATSIINH